MMEAEKIQSGKAQSLQITERHGEDMNIIVTVDENWAIGKGGDFLTRIPAEQRNTDSLTATRKVLRKAELKAWKKACHNEALRLPERCWQRA